MCRTLRTQNSQRASSRYSNTWSGKVSHSDVSALMRGSLPAFLIVVRGSVIDLQAQWPHWQTRPSHLQLRKATQEELKLKHTAAHVKAMFEIENMSEKELCPKLVHRARSRCVLSNLSSSFSCTHVRKRLS